jgi:hypothetical protein
MGRSVLCSQPCRPSRGKCDPGEVCTGSTLTCPNDVVLGPDDPVTLCPRLHCLTPGNGMLNVCSPG